MENMLFIFVEVLLTGIAFGFLCFLAFGLIQVLRMIGKG